MDIHYTHDIEEGGHNYVMLYCLFLTSSFQQFLKNPVVSTACALTHRRTEVALIYQIPK